MVDKVRNTVWSFPFTHKNPSEILCTVTAEAEGAGYTFTWINLHLEEIRKETKLTRIRRGGAEKEYGREAGKSPSSAQCTVNRRPLHAWEASSQLT